MLCPLLQGCVGVAVLKTQTKLISDPEISEYSKAPDVNAVWKPNPPKATNSVIYTSEWLQKHWGSPNSVSHGSRDSEETWTYKCSGRVWEGVMPFVIAPIPLALPIGKEKICFTLRDGHVTSATETKYCWVGGIYGFHPTEEGSGSWGPMSLNNIY